MWLGRPAWLGNKGPYPPIRLVSGRYASYWNAVLSAKFSEKNTKHGTENISRNPED